MTRIIIGEGDKAAGLWNKLWTVLDVMDETDDMDRG
jgi:hypothetical protein